MRNSSPQLPPPPPTARGWRDMGSGGMWKLGFSSSHSHFCAIRRCGSSRGGGGAPKAPGRGREDRDWAAKAPARGREDRDWAAKAPARGRARRNFILVHSLLSWQMGYPPPP